MAPLSGVSAALKVAQLCVLVLQLSLQLPVLLAQPVLDLAELGALRLREVQHPDRSEPLRMSNERRAFAVGHWPMHAITVPPHHVAASIAIAVCQHPGADGQTNAERPQLRCFVSCSSSCLV
jgi:hypothetical protein